MSNGNSGYFRRIFSIKVAMIELHTFVQTRLKSNTKLKILPLFYKLSVQELGNTKRRNQWFSVWKEWAKIDSRINIDEWKQSVEVLISFNGIEYNQNSEGIDAYLKCVVSNICKEVVPDIKWDDSHVQGRSNICKVLLCPYHTFNSFLFVRISCNAIGYKIL